MQLCEQQYNVESYYRSGNSYICVSDMLLNFLHASIVSKSIAKHSLLTGVCKVVNSIT